MNLRLPFAHELDYTVTRGNEHFILVRRLDRPEFVTYAVSADGECYWGHYFDDLERAQCDLAIRSLMVPADLDALCDLLDEVNS